MMVNQIPMRTLKTLNIVRNSRVDEQNYYFSRRELIRTNGIQINHLNIEELRTFNMFL